MIESIHKYMRVGLIHFMAYPNCIKGEGPIEETLTKIATDDYFDAVEISWIKDRLVRAKAKKILDTSYLTVGYGGQPRLLTTGLNINDLNEEGRLKALATLKEGIDEAYEMNAVGFAFLSGKYPEDRIEEAFEALVKSTKELCQYAKERGNINVLLEVFDYDVDKKSLIGPAPLAKRYAEEIKKEYDNFGLMVDLSHIPQIHETIEESILPVKDYILHAHMGNCVTKDPSLPAYGDQHPRFGFPNGECDVDEMVEYLKVLKDIGFLSEEKRPIVSFEVKPFGDENPDVVVANAKRVLNLAWSRV
ncbi:MAG: sugar phosphate isomerase/epimerase family protein [Clostridium sp.]|uniref:sugar phosphate isomerase/epimerase family protein n=1 Tax=Clostridium sp. TaxID=1506 RepID=UPI003D6C7AE2